VGQTVKPQHPSNLADYGGDCHVNQPNFEQQRLPLPIVAPDDFAVE
jgi:hypothetical protein